MKLNTILRMNLLILFLILSSHNMIYSQKKPDLGTDAQREAGRKLYIEKCAQCHGDNGNGKGVAAPFFQPEPRDFTAGLYKVRTTESGELPTDQDLKNIIKNGMPYTGMPAWPNLTDEQIMNLVYFIKTFNADFAGPYGAVESIDLPKPPSFSEESALRGREVYIENQCFDCHGDLGRGDGPSAPTLEDHWGKPIRPADLTKRWTFIGGKSRQDIYRTFTTGLDGTPMPSYAIAPENQWALVDYVYSLSRDEPGYAVVAFAEPVEDAIDISRGKVLFAGADSALFPVVGQVIEPGREFVPGVDAIQVKAVYNQEEIAVLLTWHDMTAETSGRNGPDLPVPRFDPRQPDTSGEAFSDAVAIQFPSQLPEGHAKPFFLFGDRKYPVDIWFADLAQNNPQFFMGRGSGNISPGQQELTMQANYDKGKWSVIFKRKRMVDDGISFEPETFVPVTFSVWDGFNRERGNRRGITSWYSLYLKPMETRSAAVPMMQYGLLALLIELGIIFWVRKKHRKTSSVEVNPG